MSWIKAAPRDSIELGQTIAKVIDGERVVLCRLSDDEICAVEDCCSHDDAPLGQGQLVGHQIECPRHGARFDVRSGAALRMPAASPIETYPARIRGEWIEVDLDSVS